MFFFGFFTFVEFCFSKAIRLIGHKSDLHTKIKEKCNTDNSYEQFQSCQLLDSSYMDVNLTQYLVLVWCLAFCESVRKTMSE